MTRTGWLAAGLAVAVAFSGGHAGAAPGGKERRSVPGRGHKVRATVTPARAEVPGIVGTLLYDNNVPFRRDGATDHVIGNLFGPGVSNPHSIQAVSFRIAQNYATDMIMSIWDPVGAAAADRLRQDTVTGLPNGLTMTVTMFTAMVPVVPPLVGLNGSFIAGIHNTFYTLLGCPGSTMLQGTCDGVALTMGSNPAPPVPSRAFRIPLMGGVFVPPTTMVAAGVAWIPGTNAIFRSTGDNLPVELLDFGVK